MDFSLIALAGTVGAGLLLLLLAWRAVRFVMRLALIGVLVLLLLAGAFFWWQSSATTTNRQEPRRPAATNSARRGGSQ